MCSPAAAPSTQTSTVDLPDWAKPYAKETLAKTSALTDINQNPYQKFGGDRIAGFQPMQQQAFESAANMGVSPETRAGAAMAGTAGLSALNTQYNPMMAGSRNFNNRSAQQYMNPYQQNVTDIAKREAGRQSDIMGTQQAGQATQAGAFGGSRFGIQQAERERNLSQQMGDIQAQGSNTAYNNAQQQFNADQARQMQAQSANINQQQYGANLGMQGLSTGLQAASALGQFGQNEYGQQMGITQMQGQMGQQQQQQAQRPLDMAYQDFQNQQNYPYKQLGFMSDMINKLPLGQKSTSQVYDQGPGTVQTLASLGGAAYGFGKSGMFGAADGGLMESYSYGGVTGQDNKDSIVGGMYSVEDLQKAREAALNRRDLDTVASIDERLQELQAIQQAQTASIDRGLGSAFNQIPEDQQEQMMAGGGMVAFAPGGSVYGKKFEDSLVSLQDMANQQPAPATPEQYEQGVTARQPMLEKLYGPDATQPFAEEIKAKRTGLADQFDKDKWAAFAMSSLGMLARKRTPGESQKNQLFSGLGEAGQAFIGEVGRLKKENREADDKLRQSELLITTAQQQRKEGMVNKAMSLEDKAETQKQDAFKTKMAIQEKAATLQGNMAGHEMQAQSAEKVAGINAAAHRYAADKPGEMERIMNTVNDIRSGKKTYAGKTGEDGAKAYQDDLSQTGAARYGVKYTGPDTTFANDAKFQTELDKRTAMLQLQKAAPGKTQADIDELDRKIEAERQKLITEFRETRASGVTSKNQPAPGAAPAAAPTAAPSGQSPLYVTAPDGKTYRFNTPAEAEKFRKQIGG